MMSSINLPIYKFQTEKTQNSYNPQDELNFYNELSEKYDTLLAPVGELWWKFMDSWQKIEMYAEDGAHASPQGSVFAAKIIWTTILDDMK